MNQKQIDNRLRGRTFGLAFVDKSSIRDDDLMLVITADVHRAVDGLETMTNAAINVVPGKDFRTGTECPTESKLAIKLVQL